MLYNIDSLKRLERRPFEEYNRRHERFLREPRERLICDYYYLYTGKKLDLSNPVSYNEKLQWLKLNWWDELATHYTDKLEVKQIVVSKIPGLSIIPTLAIYDTADAIEFDALPNEFVMKATHGSGFNLFINNKSLVDANRVKSVFKRILNVNYGSVKLEWNYSNIKPKIIVEPLYFSSGNSPIDYKFYCFHGEVKFVEILNACDWHYNHEPIEMIVDKNFNRLSFSYSFNNELSTSLSPKFKEMVEIAERISKPFPHVRVDLYNFSDRIFWGECTFFPSAGYGSFTPQEKDKEIGSYLNILKV